MMKNKYGVKKERLKVILKKLPYENAAIALDGWTDGGRVVGLTKGQFSLIDMINVMLEKIGPADVVISTWSAGLRDSMALNAMRESGRVRSVLIILDRSYSTRQPEYAVTVEDAFGKENIRTTNTHAKFVLLRGERNTVCIRSSMNLNKNDRCENFDLDDDPRTRTPEGLQQMAADIEADPTFFENRPVLVNLTADTHQVYAGDLRAHAAHEVLHWPDIPCIVERDVPPDVMRRRAIIDNLHRETWAPDILVSSWADDDLTAWGLTPDKWGADADTPAAAGYTASEDDYEPPAEIVTDIVPGDLFEIGPHRLLCGDSTSADDVAKVMRGEMAHAVLTDPPYGQNQPGVTNDAPENHNQILKDCISILPIKNAVIVAFNSPRTFPAWLIPCLENGHKFERMFWLYKKAQNAYPFRGWLLTSEAILVSSVGKPNWNDVHPYVHDCYEVSEVSGELPDDIGWHGSVKPVKIVGDLCQRISFENNIILDPFLGSGTTMVAVHQLHRRCFGLEIDPKYCQVIVDRMIKLDPALTITRNGKKYETP